MKLFQTYSSPFPTRVRLMIYAKGLEQAAANAMASAARAAT